MKTRYFENYGKLSWLEPEEFWDDKWLIVEITDDDYDIVVKDNEYRYTDTANWEV